MTRRIAGCPSKQPFALVGFHTREVVLRYSCIPPSVSSASFSPAARTVDSRGQNLRSTSHRSSYHLSPTDSLRFTLFFPSWWALSKVIRKRATPRCKKSCSGKSKEGNFLFLSQRWKAESYSFIFWFLIVKIKFLLSVFNFSKNFSTFSFQLFFI